MHIGLAFFCGISDPKCCYLSQKPPVVTTVTQYWRFNLQPLSSVVLPTLWNLDLFHRSCIINATLMFVVAVLTVLAGLESNLQEFDLAI